MWFMVLVTNECVSVEAASYVGGWLTDGVNYIITAPAVKSLDHQSSLVQLQFVPGNIKNWFSISWPWMVKGALLQKVVFVFSYMNPVQSTTCFFSPSPREVLEALVLATFPSAVNPTVIPRLLDILTQQRQGHNNLILVQLTFNLHMETFSAPLGRAVFDICRDGLAGGGNVLLCNVSKIAF